MKDDGETHMTWGEAGRVAGVGAQRIDMGVPAGSFALLVQRLHDASIRPGCAERPAALPVREARRA